MGKKSTKVLSGALATTTLLGSVMGATPASAATNLDAVYKNAFDAVMKAKDVKTQESITAARKAIIELEKEKDLKGFVGEFSKQTDMVQQKLFDDFYSLLFVDGKKKDKVSQEDVNKAREYVKAFDTFEGNKAYTASWSTAVDGFQQILIVEANDAVVKAMTSKNEKDVKAAEELVKVLATSTNEQTKQETAKFTAIIKEVQKEIDKQKEVLKIDSVTAVTAKTLEVKFSKVVDTSKVSFELKKDSFKSNFSTIKWNDEKTVATIELTSKINKGEYVVNVTGVKEGTLTGSVKTEDEKVSKIEILSDIAPIKSKTEATVGFKVTNQYNEDITKLMASSLVNSVAGASKATTNADGSILIEKADEFKENDKVVITLIHAETAVTTTKTITISSLAKAAEVKVGALYNKDGKTINEDTDLSKDKFYLPVEVKDQYGNVITDLAKLNDGILLTNTNPAVIGFGAVEKQTIDNKEVTVIPVIAGTEGKIRAGQATATIIAKANGKNTQATVTVAEGLRSDAIALSAPNTVVAAGEDVLLPLNVMDKEGKAITDLKILKDANKGIKVVNGELVVKDNAFFIKIANGDVKENTPVTVVVTSSTNKVVTQTIMPKEAAQPKVITGLTGVSTSIRPTATSKITYENIKIEDQYGRVMPKEAVAKMLGSGYSIKAKLVDKSKFALERESIAVVANEIKVKANASNEKVSENITFVLVKDAKEISATAFDAKFQIVPDSEFASYEVADIDTIYVKKDETTNKYKVPADYVGSVGAKAITKDGGKVTLTVGKDFTVKSTVLTGLEDGKIKETDVSEIKFADGATTTTAKVVVTINATGEEFVKEVKFSNEAPKVTKVELVENSKGAAYIDGEDVKVVSADKVDINGKFGLEQLLSMVDVVVTDQYGVQQKLNESDGKATFAGVDTPEATLTLTKVSGNVTFKNNGTKDANVDTAELNSVFNARVSIGGVNAGEFKVTVNSFKAQ